MGRLPLDSGAIHLLPLRLSLSMVADRVGAIAIAVHWIKLTPFNANLFPINGSQIIIIIL